jgi:hypothetical protein
MPAILSGISRQLQVISLRNVFAGTFTAETSCRHKQHRNASLFLPFQNRLTSLIRLHFNITRSTSLFPSVRQFKNNRDNLSYGILSIPSTWYLYKLDWAYVTSMYVNRSCRSRWSSGYRACHWTRGSRVQILSRTIDLRLTSGESKAVGPMS